MKKKIYWKDIWLSIHQSKGRFFSIFSLMMIGSMALVGLKVTTPNMEQTAQDFVEKSQMLDLAVMADYGLDEADIRELKEIPDAQVEFSYLTDVTIAGKNDAVRIFSKPNQISQFQLVSGVFPKNAKEIALSESLKKNYKLGDTISFQLGDKSLLKDATFIITGFIQSSEIWDRTNISPSAIGTGELAGYAVTSSEAFDSDVYTLARIRYNDLAALPYYSSAYEETLAQHQQDLEKILADNGQQRLQSIKADVQKKIDDGQAEIVQSEKALSDAQQKIKDGEDQLVEGQGQLDRVKEQLIPGQSKLASSWQELVAAKATLDATARELDTAKARLDTTAQELEDTRQQLDSNKASLDRTKTQLDLAASQLASAKSQLDAKNQELNLVAAQITEAQFQLQTAKQALEERINQLIFEGKDPYSMPEIQAAQAEIQAQEASLAQAMQSYEAGFAQYQASFSQYQEQEKQYQSGKQLYEAGLAQYQEAQAQYESGLAQYQEAQAQYASGYAQYQDGLARYQAGLHQYQTSQTELGAADETITHQESELSQARNELVISKEKFEKESSQAQKKLQDAKTDLQEAQAEAAGLKPPVYQVYSRSTFPGSYGYENYRESTTSISSVGNIFPVVLYLIAALVSFTTMTRFVDEERNNLGILGALGYTKGQIITKFVIYGLLASFVGTLVGILLGNILLSPMISTIISKTTVIGQSNLYFYPSWTILALGLALLSAVLPTYLVARKELENEPAQLLQGKPPVAGSTILLEKIPFIWKKLSFTQKVTARNIFRYKLRMFMTIFGVAGSVALLFAGLGIQSSVSGIADTQFGELISYDIQLLQKEEASAEEVASIQKVLQSDKVKKSVSIYSRNLSEKVAGENDKIYINLMVANQEDLKEFVQLRKRGKDKINLTNNGAVLTEKLASLYGVKVGDAVTLHLDDKDIHVQVAAIAEMYTGHFIYMTPAYYEKITGRSSKKNSYLIIPEHQTPSQIKNLAAEFLAMKGVEALVQHTALIALINQVADSLHSVMVILTILSVLLAVVILFNLTTINVAERIRELSTIRVLGFHNREVTLYIYRETIVLAIVGILVGLGAGYALHKWILRLLGSSTTMFNPTVPIQGYLIPVISVISILAILGIMVNRRLRQVDMLEALKSGE
ncbi:MAG: FtsX-like permease family protein [Streptococcus minor]|nr:FtsX-like permease family protein [Streptococcus minor]